MQAFTLLAVLLFCGFASARDERLSEDCLRGVTDRNKCCSGVPDAWYAHLRNPEDCASFYQCEHGKPTWKACAEGTHWSVEADRCEWPHEAKCTVDPQPEPTTEHTPTGSTSGPKLPSGCYDGSIDAKTCCVGISDWWVHLPDPENCGKFYQCDNGKAVHKDCSAGLHWSVAADRCEWPQIAGCVGSGTKPTLPSSTVSPTSSLPSTTATPEPPVDECVPEVEPQCLKGMVAADLCCRDVATYHKIRLADASDCSSYYQCANGHAVQRQCPAGLHWSVDSDRCEHPADAQCSANVEEESSEEDNPEDNGSNESSSSDEDDNNDGAVSKDCLSGKISAEECCRNVPYWVDVLLQNNADCHTYLQCVHGKPMVRPCPANLWWSITRNRCEWKKNATCTW